MPLRLGPPKQRAFFALPESQRVAGLICFYPEKVDLYVDGVKLD